MDMCSTADSSLYVGDTCEIEIECLQYYGVICCVMIDGLR